MKLLIATPLYPPEIGGPATYVAMLERELPAHGIELTIVPFARVRHLPKLVRHLAYTWLLWRASRDARAVYALDGVSVGVPAVLVSWWTKLPFVVRLGGDYAWEQGQQRFGVVENLDDYTKKTVRAPWPVRVLAWLQASVVRRATYVIAPSAYLQSVIATWGVDVNKIEVIYSAYEPLPEPEAHTVAKIQATHPGPRLLTAARLVPWKGCAMLIDCVAALRSTYPTLTLFIAGDGPQLASLRTRVHERGVDTEVQFLGRLDKHALAAYLTACDLFLLNTTYEGLSHQLLEAMAAGLPIVTTPVGGNIELVSDRETGRLLPPNDLSAWQDTLSALLEDRRERDRLSVNAQKRLSSFSTTAVRTRLIHLFQML